MLWFFLSVLTALASASEAATVKSFFGSRPALEMAAYPLAWSLPLFLAVLAFMPPMPTDSGFWITMAVLVPLNVIGLLLHLSAINVSPISLTMPFLAFTPAFAILTGFLILGERVTAWGGAGIAAVAAGGYILNLDARRTGGVLGPIKAIVRERGSLYMLMASFMYAFCAILGKKLTQYAQPLHAASLFYSVLDAACLIVIAATGNLRPRRLVSRPWAGLATGSLMLAEILLHFTAVSMVTAAYMVAVKRLNGLFSVLYGRAIFKETDIGLRLAGAALMALGAAFIAILG